MYVVRSKSFVHEQPTNENLYYLITITRLQILESHIAILLKITHKSPQIISSCIYDAKLFSLGLRQHTFIAPSPKQVSKGITTESNFKFVTTRSNANWISIAKSNLIQHIRVQLGFSLYVKGSIQCGSHLFSYAEKGGK